MSDHDYIDADVSILHGDCIERMLDLDAGSAHTCVTSPPYYGLRDYGSGNAQIGLEESPDAYIARLVDVFREVRRVLANDGTVWLNLGDSYSSGNSGQRALGMNERMGITDTNRRQGQSDPRRPPLTGNKPKNLLGIPWLVALALQGDGWHLRSDIIWHKPNPMPESVTDRPTRAHEYVFLLSKSQRYYYDADAIREDFADERKGASGSTTPRHQWGRIGGGDTGLGSAPAHAGRNKRSVWSVAPEPYAGAHFAVFPPALIEPCILAGSPEGGIVLDPFMGSGTTAHTARRLGRRAIGTELNEHYISLARERLSQQSLLATTTEGFA